MSIYKISTRFPLQIRPKHLPPLSGFSASTGAIRKRQFSIADKIQPVMKDYTAEYIGIILI